MIAATAPTPFAVAQETRTLRIDTYNTDNPNTSRGLAAT